MKKNILLVDDEPDLTRVLTFMLRKSYDTTVANSVDSAVDHLRKTKVDLILSDYMMRGKNGFDLAEYVRDNVPETKFLLMTGNITQEIEDKYKSLKISSIILKPFEGEELISKISTILS